MPTITKDPAHIVEHLLEGKPAVIPTETVYGLAAVNTNHNALRAIFTLKGRPLFNPLITHCPTTHHARELAAHWPQEATALAARFWPGPLTIVLQKRTDDPRTAIPDLVTAGLPTAAIRVPSHPVTLEILRQLDDHAINPPAPLAAPSANRAGRTSPTTAQHASDEFHAVPGAEDLLILDAGPTAAGIESTIIDLSNPQTPALLRPGPVPHTELEAVLGRQLTLTPGAAPKHASTEPTAPTSPGQLKHHYAPNKPLLLLTITGHDATRDADIDPARLQRAINSALPDHAASPARLPLDPEPTIAARTLYANLRALDNDHRASCIVAILTPPYAPPHGTSNTHDHPHPHARAILDRLTRAASATITLT